MHRIKKKLEEHTLLKHLPKKRGILKNILFIDCYYTYRYNKVAIIIRRISFGKKRS